MNRIDFADSFDFALRRFKANPVFYLGYSVLIVVLCWLILWGASLSASHFLGPLLCRVGIECFLRFLLMAFSVALVFLVLIAPFIAGFVRGVSKEELGGRASLGDLFSGLSLVFPLTINVVIAAFTVFLGGLCCLLPLIPLAPLPFLAIFFVARGEKGLRPFIHAIETIVEHPILIVWFWLTGMLAKAGIFLCGIGILLTLGIGICALCKLFSQASSSGEAPASNS